MAQRCRRASLSVRTTLCYAVFASRGSWLVDWQTRTQSVVSGLSARTHVCVSVFLVVDAGGTRCPFNYFPRRARRISYMHGTFALRKWIHLDRRCNLRLGVPSRGTICCF